MARYENLIDVILAACTKYPKSTALRFIRSGHVESVKYRNLEQLIFGYAHAMVEQGVKEGDYVAICAENSPHWVISCFAAFRLGATVVPIDARSRQAEITAVLQEVKPKLFLVGKIQHGRIVDAPKTVTIQIIEELLHAARETTKRGSLPAQKHRSLDNPALLVFTSGTGGTPKGVVLSHGNIIANVNAALKRFDVTAGDKLLSILPLSHMFEFTAGLIGPLTRGATVVYSRLKGVEHLKELLKIERISALIGVPSVYQNILRSIESQIEELPLAQRLQTALGRNVILANPQKAATLGRLFFPQIHKEFGGKIKFWAAGGAPVSADLVQSLASFGIPLLAGYGLTEASPIVAANSRFENRLGSCGKALANVSVRIAPEADGGDGEILVKGPSVMTGYRQKGETEQVIKDGWLHTGDRGHIDKQGYLYVTGRKKSTIVTAGGYNLQPEELEAALERSREIKEVCVFGRSSGSGEQPYALIVPKKAGADKEALATVKQEVTRCLSDFADYKRLTGFEVFEGALPRTPSGKLLRSEAARIFEELKSKKGKNGKGGWSEPYKWDKDGEAICKIVGELADQHAIKMLDASESTKNFQPTTNLSTQLGIDSFARLELILRLEDELSTHIDEEAMQEVHTVEELVSLVKYHKKKVSTAMKKESITSSSQEEFLKALSTYARAQDEEKVLASYGVVSAAWPVGARPRVMLNVPDDPFIVAARRSVVVAARVFMQIWNEFETTGSDRLALDPPFIVAANHTSHMDTLALLASFPANLVKLVHPVAAADTFFVDPITAHLSANFLNAIPFDRYGNFEDSLKDCEAVLRKGEILIVFPEGTRSSTGELAAFKAGVAKLAITVGCPIVPAYLSGTHEVLPKNSMLPRASKLSVHFGTPLYPPPPPVEIKQCQQLTATLQKAVESLRSGHPVKKPTLV